MKATLLFDNADTDDGVEQTVVVAVFHIEDHEPGQPDLGLQDPVFPQLYQAATNYNLPWPNALCMHRRKLARIDETSCYALAIFVHKKTFNFGPQPISQWENDQETLPVPFLTDVTPTATGPRWYTDSRGPINRPVTVRVKQSFRVGDEQQAEAFAQTIDPNVGLLYGPSTSPLFPRIYQLRGYSMTRYSNNQIIITYRFRTTADIAAIGPTPALGLDVGRPALGPLDGYQPVVRSGQPATVQVFGVRQMQGFGAPLP